MLTYRFLTIILSPVIFGHIVWLSIKNKQSRYFWQRLGFNYTHLPTNSLWFHCASVGEVNTVLPLIKNIHKKDNQLKFLITTNTITGAQIVSQQNFDYLFHSYLPFDWVNSINRFLSKTRPTSVYIMETEIWPNLFSCCSNINKPVSLINARLSKKTTAANKWIKSLLKHSLSKTKAIYTRSEEDKRAYLELGAPEQIVSTAGNLKLTTMLNNTSHKHSSLVDREYVLFASTHKGEESLLYKTWKALHRNELLIIAPRHPQRSTSIIKQLNIENIAIRSKGDAITEKTEVYLLDTVGELKNYFSDAKLVVMGGSFVPIGGHNILEPASLHSAIITGPYMTNFKEELELMLAYNAIIQTTSVEELKQQIKKTLEDKHYRDTLKNSTLKISSNIEKILESYTELIFEHI